MASVQDEALDLLTQARRASNRGDDDAAMRLVNQSLKIYQTDEGRDLKRYFDRFGPLSPAAAAVIRVLSQGLTHYEVLKLKASAPGKDVKRAYKQLSLECHPDRNHARSADEAFKRINEAFCVLGNARSRAAYDAELRTGHRGYHASGGYPSPPPRHPPPPPRHQQRPGSTSDRPGQHQRPGSTSDRAAGGTGGTRSTSDFPRRDTSVEELMRENQQLRAELHRRRSGETQAEAHANVSQREARAAAEELVGLRRKAAESERLRREEVQQARAKAETVARAAVHDANARLAASEERNGVMRRQMEKQRVELSEARAESEAVTAAVNALLNRVHQQRGDTAAIPTGNTHPISGRSGPTGEPVMVVGSKVSARELIMRLASTLASDVGSSLRRVRSKVAVHSPSVHSPRSRPSAQECTSRSPLQDARMPRPYKTMATLRAEAVAERRARESRFDSERATSFRVPAGSVSRGGLPTARV